MDSFESQLHSAAAFGDLEATELVLKERMNTIFKYEQGVTLLHLLMEKRMEMFDSLRDINKKLSDPDNRFQGQKKEVLYLYAHSDETVAMKEEGELLTQKLDANERCINKLLTSAIMNFEYTDEKGLLLFHAACMLRNCVMAQSLLQKVANVNQPINENSSMWPGYTGLHFAAQCGNIEMIKMLIAKGANLLTCNAEGITPLDICIKFFEVKQIHSILTCVSTWKNILFSDGKTKLMDYILLLESNDPANYLQSVGKVAGVVSSNFSPLWPGYTILHLGVHLLPETQYDRIYRILNSGASVTTQDSHGSTPVHLAFRLGKIKFLKILLEYHEKVLNPLDHENLSHLHIACALNNENLVTKLLTIEANFNIAYNGRLLPKLKPGWTPLNIACFAEHMTVSKMLLDAGAKLIQANFTSIHEIFPLSKALTGNCDKSLLELLVSILWMNEKLLQLIQEEMGLTMLHVACYVLDHEKIEDLLDKKVDVNARIHEDSSIWPGYTPLHVLTSLGITAEVRTVGQELKLLLDEGANVTTTDAHGYTPVHLALKSSTKNQAKARANVLIKHHCDFSVNPTSKEGLSHFHIACLVCSPMTVKGFLQCGIDANQVVKESVSELAGMSPLHLALHSTIFGVELQLQTIDILLAHGANVDAVDPHGWTVLHHMANNGSVLEKLLERIVRANPNMNKESVNGQTPIEILIQSCTSVKKLRFFIENGSHVNSYNPISNRGYMSMILSDERCKKQLDDILELMISSPDIINIDERGRNAIFNTFWSDQIHLGEDEFVALIEKLIKLGCDIHQQDREGKTPLHVAVELHNLKVVSALLKNIKLTGKTPLHVAVELHNLKVVSALLTCGADINRVDSAGKSPFYYCVKLATRIKSAYYPILIGLMKYLSKLTMVGLDISQLNTRILRRARLIRNFDADEDWVNEDEGEDENRDGENVNNETEDKDDYSEDEDNYSEDEDNEDEDEYSGDETDMHEVGLPREVEKTKTEKIGKRGLTLYDFVFENDVVKIISLFTREERDLVNVVLESIDSKTYKSLRYLLKLQYRKVVERLSLISPAALSLNTLLGFPLPALCVENVFRFLTTAELKCLVSAGIHNNDSGMIIGD